MARRLVNLALYSHWNLHNQIWEQSGLDSIAGGSSLAFEIKDGIV